MNVLIVSTNQSASPMPVLPSGACMVAEAAERAGHRVEVLDLMFEPDPQRKLKRRLEEQDYDVVGLSIRNIDNNDLAGTQFYLKDVRDLVDVLRSRSDARLVAGGSALAVMPREIMRYLEIDLAVIGDGEKSFCDLLEAISEGRSALNISGVASLCSGRFQTTPPAWTKSECTSPAFDRWLDVKAYRSSLAAVPLQTKLGCQFRCVYCTYQKIEGGAFRMFDPGSVVENARRLASSGHRDIEFVDNVFNAPCDRTIELCEALARDRTGARFQSLELNPSFLGHDLLASLERAGFTGIGLTVESACDPVLHGLRKGFTADHVRRAAELLRRHSLPCVWIFLLGGPGETRETVRETLRFAERQIRPGDAAFFNIGIRIYPGTELESLARSEGVLSAAPDGMLEPVFYVSPGVEASWIRSQVAASMSSHMNFMSADTFSVPYLPLINRIGHRLGLRPPLWRYTGRIRKGLRFLGLNV